MQKYIKTQTEKDDTARQHAIVEVIKQFEHAKALKERLRPQYVECNDISDERKAVIDQFLYDEARKDGAVSEMLWVCVNKIQAQIYNKIHWSFEKNVAAGSVSQQSQQFVQDASTSSDAPRFVEQQLQQPHLDQEDAGWNESQERELSRLEAKFEAEKFANYSPYDDGYRSDNSQTWDHPDYL